MNPAFLPNAKRTGLISKLFALLSAEEPLIIFESLLALTNLAQLEDSETAQKFLDLQIIAKAQTLMFEENVLLRRAALELACNLLICIPPSAEHFQRWDFVNALLRSDDLPTARAAAGCLVSDPSQAKEDHVVDLLASGNSEIQERLIEVVRSRPEWWESLRSKVQQLSNLKTAVGSRAASLCLQMDQPQRGLVSQ